MRSFILPFTLLLLGATLGRASSSPHSRPHHRSGYNRCSQVVFQLSATAENIVFANQPDPNNETEILQWQTAALYPGQAQNGTQTVSGSFALHGVYCKPKKKILKNANTLQLLVHGVTYNSTMWSGYGFGDRFNWHAYAGDEGYHTLAIDRLGHGLNSRNHDPLNVVQVPLQIELLHQLITAVRTDTANNALDRGFSKIAYVGHSFGSLLGGALISKYPTDAEAVILTGYSTTVTSYMLSVEFESAATHDPVRFAGVALGYVVMKHESQRTAAFYLDGHFPPAIAAADYAYEDIVTIGEMGSFAPSFVPATGYTGKVFVVTGVEDLEFCVATQHECDAILQNTGLFYPDASVYEYYAPKNTGHDLTLHYSAKGTFERVHDFLKRVL